MAKNPVPQITDDGTPKNILAAAIVKISVAVVELQKSGLNEDAICALVKDHTSISNTAGIPKGTTKAVLRAIRELRDRYTTR